MPSIPTDFPPELLSQIVGHLGAKHEDLIYQWTVVRHVSRAWKAGVEERFASQVLPKTAVFLADGKTRRV